ncbi:MAG TPA: phage holin family protein [Polyangiaceae bacterium]|nr:phage holin family protein [Polyangiaceae bacterium]
MDILLSWLVLSVAVYLTAVILPGFEVRGFGGAIVVAAIFGFLNWLLGWLIFVVLGIATLGIGFLLAFLTRWLVMAILLKVTDSFSKSLHIKSFGTAMLAALLMSLFGTIGEFLIRGMT